MVAATMPDVASRAKPWVGLAQSRAIVAPGPQRQLAAAPLHCGMNTRFPLTLRMLLAAVAAANGTAQTCFHRGSVPRPAIVEAAPFSLGCSGAPEWPAFHLFTPAHREPAPHFGFAPGQATARYRWLVSYRCTGLLLVPVLPERVRRVGYVIDQPEFPCGGPAR